MSNLATARTKLIDRGLLRREGERFVITEAGEAWIDQEIARLKREVPRS